MLVKFIDKERIEIFKNYYIKDETVYTNAEAEKYAKQEGYKELIIEEKPIYKAQEEYLTEYFEETTKNILKKWEINKIEDIVEG